MTTNYIALGHITIERRWVDCHHYPQKTELGHFDEIDSEEAGEFLAKAVKEYGVNNIVVVYHLKEE